MAQLTFPITSDGLVVAVWIGLSGKTTTALATAKQPIQPPVNGRGLLDTGSNVTAVAPWMLQRLGIPPATVTSTHTAAGQTNVRLFEVSVGITDLSLSSKQMLTIPDLLVMELTTTLPDADALIGMDVIMQCELLVNGPAKEFGLTF